MIGTEQGTVLMCNRKAKNPRTGSASYRPPRPGVLLGATRSTPSTSVHRRLVRARVVEDLKTPIMTAHYHGTCLTGSTWSPTPPGVFFTIKADGEMDVWDYYYKQDDPRCR